MSDRPARGRLFRKYVVVFLLLVGGVLLVSSAVDLYFSYQETKAALVRIEREQAVAAAARIEQFVQDIERQVRWTTQAAFDDPVAAQEQREIDYLRLLRNVPAIAEISHLDASGKERLRLSRLTLDAIGSQEDHSRAPKFLEARAGKTYFSPVYFRNESEPYMTVAVPAGEYGVEVTVAEVNLKAIWDVVSRIRIGKAGYAYVVDSLGRLVAHPDISLVLQKRDLSALPQIRSARGPRPAGGDEGVGMIAAGLQGGQFLTAYAPIAPLGWLVFVEQPLGEAFAPLQASIVRSIILFVLGLVLSVLASVLLARRMVAPIRVLQAGAARIGAGDLSHRIEVRTGDELETLGDEFNRTAAQLQESYASLEQKVEARTRELSKALEEVRALSEIGQAVSSTLDLPTVLTTIVSRAVQLSDANGGVIYEYADATQEFHLRASHRMEEELVEVLRAAPIRLGEGTTGHAAAIRAPVQVADIRDEQQHGVTRIRPVLARLGYRSVLAVPLLLEQRIVGALTVWRREVGSFSPEVVNLLQTLAGQSVLAIQNARLFREIQRQKQYADALVDTSPVAIATMDLRGTVVGWNPGAERLFGYTQAEAIGREVDDLVATPEIREEVRAYSRQTLSGERIHAITRRARKDGTLVDVEVSSVPVVVDGAEVGFIAIYHDITELRRARREAEAATEAKSAFLATMSHEIRTPMNAVVGMSGLLLNTALTEEQREYAEIVRQSGDALLTVINDILDFSKIEAGKLELESQPFDIMECVESALDLVATRAAEKGLDLAYLMGDGTPAAIVGDVTRLRQVLLNLLSNAVKFTEQGEVVLSVSAHRLDDTAALHELAFSVRDTGIGIPPDRLGRLFQSFSQVDASTTRRYGGTGLGLAISQRLTELMGGRISVTSQVGTGTEFHFTIRAPAAEVPIPTRRDLSGVQPSLRGQRVLVVDDNATNRRILTSHLDAWGMRARATASPGEALEWIGADERFDVGILDMHMPEMDGVTLARAIREHPAGAALPLILFTSLGRREARAGSEGFAAYLHKPIKPSQLFDALVSVLADRPVHVPQRGVARSEFDPDMARRHPLRILLAEDNVVNQKVALRLLGQMGYRADVAANGLEAIDAVERQTYDVVLMDVQMPEFDGFEASREINRRWPGERRPRLVAMTANAMQGDRELCAAAGMDDYVSKPIRVEELVAALERCRWRPEAGARGAPAEALPVPSPLATPPLEGPVSVAPRSAGPDGALASPVIDRTAFERLTTTMGRDFVAELIDTFVEDGRELIATLRRALAERDLDAFRRAAHSLKSNSQTLGAGRLAALARDLEAMARAGSLDGAGARLEPLVGAYDIVARTLGELRRDLPA